jgi:predicted permease
MLVLLFGAVALMLLIASVNVANLMLVRTKARALELAMRSALGASPGRVLRQILAESAVLAAAGGMLGMLLAVWGVNVLVSLAPQGLPRVDEIAVNGRVAAFGLAATIVVAFGFGFWPAWRASRTPLAAVQSGVRSTASHERRRSQLLLVSSELAIAQVLLVAAGLLIASFARLTSLDPGFDPRDLVAVDVSLPGAKYRDADARFRFHEAVLDRLSAAPGVRSVAMAMQAPMRPNPVTRGVWIEGRPALPPGVFNLSGYMTVSEEYFATTGIRLVRGRSVARDDTARSPDVVVINEAFARQYFPGEDPLGKRVGYGSQKDPHYWRTVVGIAADTREQLGVAPKPMVYAPFRQGYDPFMSSSYIVKSSLPVATVGEMVQQAVIASDPDQPVSRLRPVEADMHASVATQRFTMLVAGMFATLALVLAAVGTFGVMSHVVRGRTREIGVRMALGATGQSIVRLVLGEAGVVVLASTVVGLVVAAVVGPSFQTLLFDVRPRDPATMALAASTLVAVAILASYVPIRRMLAQNPLTSLKSE